MSADLSQLRIPTVPLPTAETQELHTHSHSKQTRSNQHLKPAGMSPVSIESRGLVKKADRYSEDETSPDSFTDEAAEQCHKKKEEKNRVECFGLFCVSSLTEENSLSAWKMLQIMQNVAANVPKQQALLRLNVFNPHERASDEAVLMVSDTRKAAFCGVVRLAIHAPVIFR